MKRISATETVIKRILPYLQRRGYDIHADMVFEEPVASAKDHPRKGFIDIEVRCGRTVPQFLVEAKRDGTNINAAHRNQALDYGKKQKVLFVALTNGKHFELLNTATRKPLSFNGTSYNRIPTKSELLAKVIPQLKKDGSTRSRPAEESWGGFVGLFGFGRGGEEVEDIALLLAAGFDHTQQGFHEAAAGGALRAV